MNNKESNSFLVVIRGRAEIPYILDVCSILSVVPIARDEYAGIRVDFKHSTGGYIDIYFNSHADRDSAIAHIIECQHNYLESYCCVR